VVLKEDTSNTRSEEAKTGGSLAKFRNRRAAGGTATNDQGEASGVPPGISPGLGVSEAGFWLWFSEFGGGGGKGG
jgi:hypothetical protein